MMMSKGLNLLLTMIAITFACCKAGDPNDYMLYYATNGHIMRTNMEGECPEVFIANAGVIGDIVVGANHIFWFDEQENAIKATHIDNVNEHEISSFTVDKQIAHLAVDEEKKIIFATDLQDDLVLRVSYTEQGDSQNLVSVGNFEEVNVRRCDETDSNSCQNPIDITLSNPFGIVLDKENEIVFVTQRLDGAAVVSFNYDGSHYKIIADENDDAEGLVYFANSKKLFYADKTAEKIMFVNLETNAHNKFVSWDASLSDVFYIGGIEDFDSGVDIIYWADETGDRIVFQYTDERRDDLGSVWHSTTVISPLEDTSQCVLGTPKGLALVRQRRTNPVCVCNDHYCRFSHECIVSNNGIQEQGCCCSAETQPRGICIANQAECDNQHSYGGRCLFDPNYQPPTPGEGGDYGEGEDGGMDIVKILALIGSALAAVSMAITFFLILFS